MTIDSTVRDDLEVVHELAGRPQPNEIEGLLALVALRQEQHVGMVGARGVGARVYE